MSLASLPPPVPPLVPPKPHEARSCALESAAAPSPIFFRNCALESRAASIFSPGNLSRSPTVTPFPDPGALRSPSRGTDRPPPLYHRATFRSRFLPQTFAVGDSHRLGSKALLLSLRSAPRSRLRSRGAAGD